MVAVIIILLLIALYFLLMIFYPEWVGISGLAERKKRQKEEQAKKDLNL